MLSRCAHIPVSHTAIGLHVEPHYSCQGPWRPSMLIQTQPLLKNSSTDTRLPYEQIWYTSIHQSPHCTHKHSRHEFLRVVQPVLLIHHQPPLLLRGGEEELPEFQLHRHTHTIINDKFILPTILSRKDRGKCCSEQQAHQLKTTPLPHYCKQAESCPTILSTGCHC